MNFLSQLSTFTKRVLAISIVLILAYPLITFSDAAGTARAYAKSNDALRQELGDVQGIDFIPTGSVETVTDNTGEHGMAVINMTVKGSNKYKDVVMYVIKTVDSPDWKVESVE